MRIIKSSNGSQTLYKIINERSRKTVGKATLSRTDEKIRLHTIQVQPNFRGRGYGKMLMERIIRDESNRVISLCTHYGNVSFFGRFDFEILESREKGEVSTLIDMIRKPTS